MLFASAEFGTVSGYFKDEAARYDAASNLHNDKISQDFGIKSLNAEIVEEPRSHFEYQEKEHCDSLTSNYSQKNPCNINVSTKINTRTKSIRRNGHVDPPPRPPCQKQQFPDNLTPINKNQEDIITDLISKHNSTTIGPQKKTFAKTRRIF